MGTGGKIRIDLLLVGKGFFPSRQQAQRAIMAGLVFCRGERLDKPGTMVDPAADVEVRGNACPYVSRGGLKLEKALDEFGISVLGKQVLDAGASTGGFTQCLLERGAARVFAVDVGYGQLAWQLRQDSRVVVFERTNLRYLTPDQLGAQVDLATLDLSFISLNKVLPAVRGLLKPRGEVVALVKPQFEAGRQHVGKGGVVRDPGVHQEVLEKVICCGKEQSFAIRGLTHSPVLGADGNLEFFIWMSLGEVMAETPLPPLHRVVAAAHRALLHHKERDHTRPD